MDERPADRKTNRLTVSLDKFSKYDSYLLVTLLAVLNDILETYEDLRKTVVYHK